MTKDLIFENNEMKIVGGDLFVDESDQQHIQHVLICDLGQFRQFPLLGVGIRRQINGSVNRTDLKQLIRNQLKSDNFTVKNIEVTRSFEITINAKRNE